MSTSQPPSAPSDTDAPVQEAETKSASWLDKLNDLARHRDALLIITGACFLLGYGTILYNAARNNLGFIPPFQPQCLLAGIVPLVFLILCGFLVRISIGISTYLVNWSANSRYYNLFNRKFNSRLLFLSFVSSLLYIALIPTLEHFMNSEQLVRFKEFKNFIGLVTAYFLMIGNIVVNTHNPTELANMRNPDERARTDRLFQYILIFVYVGSFTSVCFSTWLNVIYPNTQQEFGGMKPRIAYLDFKQEDVSFETRALLLPVSNSNASKEKTTAVLRSQLLDVYYENSDALFVRPHRATLETPVQQLKKDVIKGVTWCGYSEPQLEKNGLTGTKKATLTPKNSTSAIEGKAQRKKTNGP